MNNVRSYKHTNQVDRGNSPRESRVQRGRIKEIKRAHKKCIILYCIALPAFMHFLFTCTLFPFLLLVETVKNYEHIQLINC